MRPATRIHPEREPARALSREQEGVVRLALEQYSVVALRRLGELVQLDGRQSNVALGACRAILELSLRDLPDTGSVADFARQIAAVEGIRDRGRQIALVERYLADLRAGGE
jgi:hypothetical protein